MKGLDRYLTTPPEDNFTEFCELVIDKLPDNFYNENEDWLTNGQCDELLNKLYNRDCDRGQSFNDMIIESSKILQRIFSLYKLKQNGKV